MISKDERDELIGKDNSKLTSSKIKLDKLPVKAGIRIITGLIVISCLMIIVTKGIDRSVEMDLKKAPYFYEVKGDMYVLFHGEDEGIELVEDYYDDYCDFTVIDEERIVVIEDKTLYLVEGVKERIEIAEDVISYLPSPSGESIILTKEDGEVFLYNKEKILPMLEQETNGDFTFSEDEEVIGFSYFRNNKKIFAIYTDEKLIEHNYGNDYVFVAYESVALDRQYIYALDEDGEPVLLVSDDEEEVKELFKYKEIYWDENHKKALVYYEDDIYYFNGKKAEKVVNNIDEIVSYYQEDPRMIFKEDGAYHLYIMGDKEVITFEDSEDLISGKTFASSDDFETVVMADDNGLMIYSLKRKAYEIEKVPVSNVADISMDDKNANIVIVDRTYNIYTYKIGGEIEKIASKVDYNRSVDIIGSDRMVLIDPLGNAYLFVNNNNELIYVEDGKEAMFIAEEVSKVYNSHLNTIYYINKADQLYRYKFGKKRSRLMEFDYEKIYIVNDFLVDK